MGLGLGMGIQMGTDGRFYASMGGVMMPNSSTAESSEETTPKPNTTTISKTTVPSGGALSPKQSNKAIRSGKESLLTRQKLADVQGSYQNHHEIMAKNGYTINNQTHAMHNLIDSGRISIVQSQQPNSPKTKSSITKQ